MFAFVIAFKRLDTFFSSVNFLPHLSFSFPKLISLLKMTNAKLFVYSFPCISRIQPNYLPTPKIACSSVYLTFFNFLIFDRISLQCNRLFFPLEIAESLDLISDFGDLQSNKVNRYGHKVPAGSIQVIRKDNAEVDGVLVSASLPWWRCL